MCGISGFWGRPDPDLLVDMTRLLRHRGPDDEGFFESDHASLGFRRLAVIDLEHGRQPMGNDDGSVQIVYNGEVYNYRELRDELRARGYDFRTQSDTEVVLRAYEEYGVDCFTRFNGMWALAILDLRNAVPRLVLARDHFGIKPLFWARSGDRILFASEIKAILQDPAFVPRPNAQVIYDYLVAGLHDHTDETFFAGVQHVPAAHHLVIEPELVVAHRYWTPTLGSDARPDPDEFARLFRRSVERRLVADVPVGTCLSGGLDSSSIVCVMTDLLRERAPDAASMGDRLKTFSAVFDGDPIDEREYIEEVLRASGAEEDFVRPTSGDLLDELQRFVWHMDEPIVSSGPYAQWCVMREARRKVTVLLDGQAGDELLAGYVPYHMVYLRQLRREGRYLRLLREAIRSRDVLRPLVAKKLRRRRGTMDIRGLLSDGFRQQVHEPRDERSQDDLKARLLQDLTTYSLPSLLRYEDRNSMAHSVESRVPFLDQELVEWVLRLPPEAIIRKGWTRAILRAAMRGVLPDKVWRRRWKIGFTTPEMRWLIAERARVREIFSSPSFRSRPYWDGAAVAAAFDGACEGTVEVPFFFWRALNLEIWLRVFVDQPTTSEATRPAEEPIGRHGSAS